MVLFQPVFMLNLLQYYPVNFCETCLTFLVFLLNGGSKLLIY